MGKDGLQANPKRGGDGTIERMRKDTSRNKTVHFLETHVEGMAKAMSSLMYFLQPRASGTPSTALC